MKPENLLAELGSHMGIPNLGFDEQGCARLVFDDQIEVNFENDAANHRLQIYTTLGNVPAENKEALYGALLEANLFGSGTAGATLAIDNLHGEIVLCHTFYGDDIPSATFLSLVESFVNTAEKWAQQIANNSFTSEQTSNSDGSFLDTSFLRA